MGGAGLKRYLPRRPPLLGGAGLKRYLSPDSLPLWGGAELKRYLSSRLLPLLAGAVRRYLPSRLPPLLSGAELKRYLSPRLSPAFGWRSAALLTVSTPPVFGWRSALALRYRHPNCSVIPSEREPSARLEGPPRFFHRRFSSCAFLQRSAAHAARRFRSASAWRNSTSFCSLLISTRSFFRSRRRCP